MLTLTKAELRKYYKTIVEILTKMDAHSDTGNELVVKQKKYVEILTKMDAHSDPYLL